jgi:general secretion pathway protein D
MFQCLTPRRRSRIAAGLAVFAIACLSISVSHAARETVRDEPAILNFVDADMEAVIKALGKVTGKNFVLDPRVKGKLNILSERPVPRATFYDIVLAALRLQGYTAVEKQGYTLILPEADARQFGGRALDMKGELHGERLATRVFDITFEQPNQILQAIKPLVSNSNAATAQSTVNTVVVTDYADNLNRIGAVIQAIDQPQGDEPVLILLQHASATDVAYTLSRVIGEAGGAPANSVGAVSIVPDARSNRLIVRTSNPARLARVRALALSLDTPGVAGGRINVVSLKNAEATKIALILRAILTGEAGAGAAPPSPSQSGNAGNPTPAAASAQGTSSLPGGASIQADAATNSLIIAAPDALYRNLRGVIEQLDVRRAQIYVEALIAEIDLQKLEEFGFQWQALNGLGAPGSQTVGGTNFGSASAGTNIIGVAQNPLSLVNAKGLNLGLTRGTVTVGGQTILNLGMLAHTLDSDGKSHILSTPTLLTLDNEEAKIVIGENVPFITGQYAQTSGSTTPSPFQTIERKDVGLTLKVKPLITESGTVRLQIYQEVSAVQQGTLNNQAGPSTNKRAIESTVLVDDGQIVALGGLIQDQVDQNADKVPGLGELPLFGQLFRYDARQRKRTNLTIFLRPVILRDGLAQSRLSNSRYDDILRRQKAEPLPAHWLLPDIPVPTLPERAAPIPPRAKE